MHISHVFWHFGGWGILARMQSRMMVSWGAVLQDKYVNARDVACCPTMDLIAVLTVDRQLIVHRTVSWQKMLHVKPTEVCFTFEVVAWSPDGMQLAVGCDEGEVVVYDIATGENVELKAEESANDGRTAKRHSTCIVSMEWMRIEDEERTKSTPSASWIQPEKAKGKTPDSAMTVLLTADDQGNVGFWWQGCVLVAMTRISDHLAAVGYGGVSPLTGLTIRSMKGTPDIAALFVVVSTMRLGAVREDPTPHHILRLNLAAMSTRKSSLSKVTHVAHEVRSILQTLRTTSRQMISEWKNATRIFELKMSLIGSLYEKYGREEPPQIDMLSIIAGGISPPALAQYFAQDIQEMSVHRMQKIFMSGCDTLRSLINSKMMRRLQQLLYHATELRGFIASEQKSLIKSLGVNTQQLETLIELARSFLSTMEGVGNRVQETRQDFGLLFHWLLEKIRFHTNSASTTAGRTTTASSTDGKSLLNDRRLCDFLQRASEYARIYQKSQSHKYKVEVTFGNAVSRYFSTSSLTDHIEGIDRAWSATMSDLIDSVTNSIRTEGTLSLIVEDDVREICLQSQTQHVDSTHDTNTDGDFNVEDSDDEGGDGGIDFDPVDWSSLNMMQMASSTKESRSIMMIAILLPHRIAMIRVMQDSMQRVWSQAGCVDVGAEDPVYSLEFYSDSNTRKHGNLVLTQGGTTKGFVSMWRYEAIEFSPLRLFDHLNRNAVLQTSKVSASHSSSSEYPRHVLHNAFALSKARIFTQASRGIVCVLLNDNRLIILDAEDAGDEDGNSEIGLGHQDCSENESDVNEADL